MMKIRIVTTADVPGLLQVNNIHNFFSLFDAGALIHSAFPARGEVRDVLVALDENTDLDNLSQSLRIGVISKRAAAFLHHYLPHCKTDHFQNEKDAVNALHSGAVEGLLITFGEAQAFGLADKIVRKMNPATFTPSPGEAGTLRMENPSPGEDHIPTRRTIFAEMGFLDEVSPVEGMQPFALATATGPGLSIAGGLISDNGKIIIRDSVSGPAAHDAQAWQLGVQLGKWIQKKGGDQILYG